MHPLTSPNNLSISQDAYALAVRPTNFIYEIVDGRRSGYSAWDKFGYNNNDVSTSAPEVVATWGGSFTPLTTASTLSIVSTATEDDDGDTTK